jgi:hypothetical protein
MIFHAAKRIGLQVPVAGVQRDFNTVFHTSGETTDSTRKEE